MRYTKEARETAHLVMNLRDAGEEGRFALVKEDDIMESRVWLCKRDHENQLMQMVIAEMIGGGSPCPWCEEYGTCGKKQKGERGCKGWWLRFLTKEEEEACEKRAKGGEGDEEHTVLKPAH